MNQVDGWVGGWVGGWSFLPVDGALLGEQLGGGQGDLRPGGVVGVVRGGHSIRGTFSSSSFFSFSSFSSSTSVRLLGPFLQLHQPAGFVD